MRVPVHRRAVQVLAPRIHHQACHLLESVSPDVHNFQLVTTTYNRAKAITRKADRVWALAHVKCVERQGAFVGLQLVLHIWGWSSGAMAAMRRQEEVSLAVVATLCVLLCALMSLLVLTLLLGARVLFSPATELPVERPGRSERPPGRGCGRFALHPNSDIPGHDLYDTPLGAISALQCCNMCQRTPVCKGFTYVGEEMACWLKSGTDVPLRPLAPQRMATSGTFPGATAAGAPASAALAVTSSPEHLTLPALPLGSLPCLGLECQVLATIGGARALWGQAPVATVAPRGSPTASSSGLAIWANGPSPPPVGEPAPNFTAAELSPTSVDWIHLSLDPGQDTVRVTWPCSPGTPPGRVSFYRQLQSLPTGQEEVHIAPATVVGGPHGTLQEATLPNLAAGEWHVYRVQPAGNTPSWTEPTTLRAPPAASADAEGWPELSLLVLGPSVEEFTAWMARPEALLYGAVALLRPGGLCGAEDDGWSSCLRAARAIAERIPSAAALGSPRVPRNACNGSSWQCALLPSASPWYAVQLGAVVVIVLSSLHAGERASDQGAWLRTELARRATRGPVILMSDGLVDQSGRPTAFWQTVEAALDVMPLTALVVTTAVDGYVTTVLGVSSPS